MITIYKANPSRWCWRWGNIEGRRIDFFCQSRRQYLANSWWSVEALVFLISLSSLFSYFLIQIVVVRFPDRTDSAKAKNKILRSVECCKLRCCKFQLHVWFTFPGELMRARRAFGNRGVFRLQNNFWDEMLMRRQKYTICYGKSYCLLSVDSRKGFFMIKVNEIRCREWINSWVC